MNRMNVYSRWAMALAFVLVSLRIATDIRAGWTRDNSLRAPSDAALGASETIAEASNPPEVLLAHRPAATQVREHSTELLTAARKSEDPATRRIAQRVEESLPPGWEDSFVLHDGLLAAAALQEMARMLTHADLLGGPADARAALIGPDAEFQTFADRFALLWLERKYPLLSEEVLRSILPENALSVIPTLGPYNLFDDTEAGALFEAIARPR